MIAIRPRPPPRDDDAVSVDRVPHVKMRTRIANVGSVSARVGSVSVSALRGAFPADSPNSGLSRISAIVCLLHQRPVPVHCRRCQFLASLPTTALECISSTAFVANPSLRGSVARKVCTTRVRCISSGMGIAHHQVRRLLDGIRPVPHCPRALLLPDRRPPSPPLHDDNDNEYVHDAAAADDRTDSTSESRSIWGNSTTSHRPDVLASVRNANSDPRTIGARYIPVGGCRRIVVRHRRSASGGGVAVMLLSPPPPSIFILMVVATMRWRRRLTTTPR
jgi:hypothetical protein